MNWVFCVFQLLLTGAHSLGSEHRGLALFSRSTSRSWSRRARPAVKEANPQACFQSFMRIKGGASWVSQSNFTSKLWSQREGNSTPIMGCWKSTASGPGVAPGRAWNPEMRTCAHCHVRPPAPRHPKMASPFTDPPSPGRRAQFWELRTMAVSYIMEVL